MGDTLGDLGVETVYEVTLKLLGSFNVSQSAAENRLHLDDYGGALCVAQNMNVDVKSGLRKDQVLLQRTKFGKNRFPDSPIDSYWTLLFDALSDTTLVILIISAVISLVIGIYEDPLIGWVEGTAILVAVFSVSSITAGNDYTKQLQFRELENSSAKDELCSIVRDESIDRYPVTEVVVGDIIVLQTGDAVPADCILLDHKEMMVNEASLTGEGEDVKKTFEEDCFLLSSSLVVEGDDCHAMVIAVGRNSQWGAIKENLRVTVTNTPLQDKLEEMTKQVNTHSHMHARAAFSPLLSHSRLPSSPSADWLRGHVLLSHHFRNHGREHLGPRRGPGSRKGPRASLYYGGYDCRRSHSRGPAPCRDDCPGLLDQEDVRG